MIYTFNSRLSPAGSSTATPSCDAQPPTVSQMVDATTQSAPDSEVLQLRLQNRLHKIENARF